MPDRVVSVSRVEALVAAAVLVLMGAGVTRLTLPKRPPLRPLSVEGIHIKSEPIAQGQTIVREQAWQPPADVFIVGWTYNLGGLGAGPELLLLHEDTVLFFGAKGGAAASNPAFYAEGTGYRVKKGESVKLRFTVANEGAAGHTQGVQALVYYLPALGN